jgi:hypothetical protein
VRRQATAAPQDVRSWITLSQGDRLIYFALNATEADIWLMTLE